MRVVKTLSKKAKWQLARLHYPDGRWRFHTGSDLSAPVMRWAVENGHHERRYQLRDTHDGARVELGPNVIVEAAFRLENFGFVDRDSGFRYFARPPEVYEILAAVAEGVLRLDGGCVVGRFTFINKSKEISWALSPDAGPAALGEAPEDAPDLSQFIRDLGIPDGRS